MILQIFLDGHILFSHFNIHTPFKTPNILRFLCALTRSGLALHVMPRYLHYVRIVCSGKIDRGVPPFSGILMIEIGNIKEVRSNILGLERSTTAVERQLINILICKRGSPLRSYMLNRLSGVRE